MNTWLWIAVAGGAFLLGWLLRDLIATRLHIVEPVAERVEVDLSWDDPRPRPIFALPRGTSPDALESFRARNPRARVEVAR